MKVGLLIFFAVLALSFIVVRAYRQKVRRTKAIYMISEERQDMWYESLYRPLCGLKIRSDEGREVMISRFVEAREGLYTLGEACDILLARAKKMKKQGLSGFCYRVPLSTSNKREQKLLDRLEAKLRKLEFGI